MAAVPANAGVSAEPNSSVAAAVLTPREVTQQVNAAGALGANLTRSDAVESVASSTLGRLSAQAITLKASQSAIRTAQTAAVTEATVQRARLVELERQIQVTGSTVGQLARDSYILGGGPFGDRAAMLVALNAPSSDQGTDSLATVNYLVSTRVRVLSRLTSDQAAQLRTSAKATSASNRARAAGTRAAKSELTLGHDIAGQRTALNAARAAGFAQVGRAAGLRSILLRSGNPSAGAADRQLARALKGRDYALLMNQNATCGKGSSNYTNGRWPASARCALYAAPGQSLRRAAAMSFDAMSIAYQRQSGSALCVTDSYRSYADQVAVKRSLPGLAATPGKSKHGFGLAVDLCGGVQSFSGAAHLWMKRNAPHYGWVHPAWAEPSGVTPEPWHWEFAR